MKNIENWFFNQPLLKERSAILRMICGIVVFVYLSLGPSDDFILALQDLFQVNGEVLTTFFAHYTKLKWLTIISALFLTIGLFTPLTSLVTMLGFFINCYLNYKITPGNWGYTPHIHVFLTTLLFCQSNHKWSLDNYFWKHTKVFNTERTSFALAFLMAYVATIYFQAGLAKIFIGGLGWMTSGQTIYVFSHYFGTDFGHWLMQYPKLFSFFAFYTVIFELLFILCLFSQRGLFIGFIMCTLFHLGVGTIMTLSFWHLALLNIPLFLMPSLPYLGNLKRQFLKG